MRKDLTTDSTDDTDESDKTELAGPVKWPLSYQWHRCDPWFVFVYQLENALQRLFVKNGQLPYCLSVQPEIEQQ